VAAALLIAAFLAFRWQPDRQLGHRWEGFLDAFSTRRWGAVDAFLSPGYQDPWGHTRQNLKRHAIYALRGFTHLEICAETATIIRTGETAAISAVVRITGSGGYLAKQTRHAVNTVFSPSQFKWERQSWRPWDWRLFSIENA